MPDRMVLQVGAVAGLAAATRAVGADLGAIDVRGLGLTANELSGSRTAPALARSVEAMEQALTRVADRVEELGRRTAWAAVVLDDADSAAADGLRRGGG